MSALHRAKRRALIIGAAVGASLAAVALTLSPALAAVEPLPCNTNESTITVRDRGSSFDVEATLDRINMLNAQSSVFDVNGMVRKSVFGWDQDFHEKLAPNRGLGMHSYSTNISKSELGLERGGPSAEIWVKFAIPWGGIDVHTCRVRVSY